MARTTERVRAYYRTYDEWGRLERDAYHALEFETTWHFLRKYLPRRGRILDAGGGPGRYTIALARKGYHPTLLDISPELLEQAKKQVARARVASRVQAIVEGSIVDLSRFGDESFDAVLCVGAPLAHLLDPRDRAKALREMVRVARRSAPVFVSVIGRWAVLVKGVDYQLEGWKHKLPMYRRILRTGDFDGRAGFAPCHFFTPEELRREMERVGLRVVEQVGLEGLASTHPGELDEMASQRPKEFRAWKRFHFGSCTDPGVVSASEHFLLIGRRP